MCFRKFHEYLRINKEASIFYWIIIKSLTTILRVLEYESIELWLRKKIIESPSRGLKEVLLNISVYSCANYSLKLAENNSNMNLFIALKYQHIYEEVKVWLRTSHMSHEIKYLISAQLVRINLLFTCSYKKYPRFLCL